MSAAWEQYKQTMERPSDLWSAARADDVAEIERLLAAGAELEARDARGYSPLMLAAYLGQTAAVDRLLAAGADPNSRDGAGNTVLMGAAFKGYGQLVRKLVAAGADLAAVNQSGLDAHAFAMAFGRHEIAALLTQLMRAAD